MSQPRRPLIYRVLFNLFLVFTSLLVFLLVFEAAFRLAEKTELIPPYGIKPKPIGFKLGKHQARLVKSENPVLQVEYDLNSPGINRHGMRDRDYPVKKPANVFRIAAIGDSVTFGLGVPLKKTFARQLESRLREQQPSKLVQVMNFGVNSYDTVSQVEQIKSKVLAFEPDLILVTYILNDTMRPAGMTKSFKERHQKKKQQANNPPSPPIFHSLAWVAYSASQVYKSRMSDLVYKNSYKGASWQGVEQALDQLAQISDQHDTVVFIFPLLTDWSDYKFEEQHAQVMQALQARKIPAVDLAKTFSNLDYHEFILRPDDTTHPNVKGHDAIADAMFQWLKQNNKLPQ